MDKNNSENPSDKHNLSPFAQTFFHGTKADLKMGDLIEVGLNSNYGQRKNAKYIYLSATLNASIWGAELALGDGRERIYLVEPTGPIEDDPNLTDKKFPGNYGLARALRRTSQSNEGRISKIERTRY